MCAHHQSHCWKSSDSASSEIYMSSFYNLFKICIRICFEINKVFFYFKREEKGKGRLAVLGHKPSLSPCTHLSLLSPPFSPHSLSSLSQFTFLLSPHLHSTVWEREERERKRERGGEIEEGERGRMWVDREREGMWVGRERRTVSGEKERAMGEWWERERG